MPIERISELRQLSANGEPFVTPAVPLFILDKRRPFGTLRDLDLKREYVLSPMLSKNRLRLTFGFCIIIALTFAVYYPVLREQLVADDFMLVGRLSFAEAARYFHQTLGFGRNEYRPLTAMSYGVDQWLWHGNPAGYHLTNLLLHAFAAGLFFLMLHALSAEFVFSLLAACVFVIHPISHSRINWITARDGCVCAVFLIGAIWLYIVSRRQKSAILRAGALISTACALLAYEGAIILPVLLFAVELLFFAPGSLGGKIGFSLRKTAWFWLAAAAYLCLWRIMFSGKLGAYDLSLSPGAIFLNYTRLFSALFYGGKKLLFAAIYISLLAMSYRYLIAHWRMTALAFAITVFAFVPYCFTTGFDYRFGYVSALGIAILLAMCFQSGVESVGRVKAAMVACLGLYLCSWYAIQDRKILREWTAAGEIASNIPQTVRELHPDLPAGTTLVFTGVPITYGRAVVFPTGLETAVQRQYAVPLVVRKSDRSLKDLPEQARRKTLIFEYRGGKNPLREISVPAHQ